MFRRLLQLGTAFVSLYLLLITLSPSTVCASNLVNRLVLYLDFEDIEGGEVIDMSENNNNGSIKGNVEQADGKIGKGMRFAGTVSDYIEVQDSDSLDISDVYTAIIWVNFDKITGQSHQTFFDKGCQETTPGGWRLLKLMAGPIRWQITKGGQWLSFVDAPPAPPLKIEQWYHLAVTRDEKGNAKVYVNGEVLGNSQSDTLNVVVNEHTMKIGGSTFWGNNMFMGTLDEFAIYKGRALEPEEIKQAMEGIDTASVDHLGKLATTWGSIKLR